MPSPARGLTQPQRVELSARKLVEAAAELITEKGWEATTAAEIGRRAGYSRAMVHARYGGKDAILDAFFEHGYVERLLPTTQPDATGMENAVAHFGRIQDLYAQDHEFLRAMFVMTFEAVKTTSPVRARLQTWFERGVEAVEVGLRAGIDDGSVRPDIDVERAVNDISAAAFGIAFHWIVLSERYDLSRELSYARARIISDYGSRARR
ncbi:MAG: TetR/AcrR family transcriptional regulator [Mycobacterium sp.]